MINDRALQVLIKAAENSKDIERFEFVAFIILGIITSSVLLYIALKVYHLEYKFPATINNVEKKVIAKNNTNL
ncbi:hypothetical protein [Viridibacillus arvi]|uniref:hypothetical protein n=1 Tax=Viridibacillus arvi TaxID=263475 RepID=UPI0034CF0709